MALGSQFNTIIYFSDTGDIFDILPNRYIKSRRDLNSLMAMPDSVGMKFFYVPGYFPIDKKDWVVKLPSGLRAPRLVTRDGIDSALLLASQESKFIIDNYDKVLFEFEGGMGDYLDEADVVLQLSRLDPLKKIMVLMDPSRIDAIRLIHGFENIKMFGRRDQIAGKPPSIKFNRINDLCGNYLPDGKIGAYSKISGLDSPAYRSPVIIPESAQENILEKAQGYIGNKYDYFFVLHTMSGNTNAKSIRPEDVVDLLNPLIKNKNIFFFHLGGSGEEVIKHDRIVSLQGKLSWVEVFALTSLALGCICIDSALMHIAQHCNTPCVSFWGPTEPCNILGSDPGVTAISTSMSCAGCNKYDCAQSSCMRTFNKSLIRRHLKKLIGGAHE